MLPPSRATRMQFFTACRSVVCFLMGMGAKRHRITLETQPMEKTLHIQGMMCMHCEARVKKTLEKIEGVTEAIVSHTAGTAIVKLSAPVDNETLKKAVEDQDYPVTSVE